MEHLKHLMNKHLRLKSSSSDNDPGQDQGYQARWPAELESPPTILGYVLDVNDRGYSRDIGRSFQLGGFTHYVFGDTFCKDQDGYFQGITSNTVALVSDTGKPTKCTYQSIDDKGMVAPFLEFTEAEKLYRKEHSKTRVMLWSFSGLVEVEEGVGYVWYQKSIERKESGQSTTEYIGAGIARVEVDCETGELTTKRCGDLIWGPEEPGNGCLSAIKHGHHVYLYGQQSGSCKIILARVALRDVENREAYEHWDGEGWKLNNWDNSATLWEDIPQASVFRSNLFGEQYGFVMVGVNKWCDNKIQVGVAPNPQGPWQIKDVGIAEPLNVSGGHRYCIYAHPWASEGGNGKDLFVTWSETWPGGVVAAKLTFTMQSPLATPDSSAEDEPAEVEKEL